MKQNEQVLEAWLQMTTVINNERITPDLPYNESMICRYLYQNQDINVTATDLCNYMRMQKSQMNRTLTSMEKKQLITRIRSEQDTRKIYITLNDSMIKIYKHIRLGEKSISAAFLVEYTLEITLFISVKK